MPMGISNAPMVFSMIMQQVLGDLDFVVVYIDDICIFSESMEQHLEHIEIVMDRLERANIKLNPDKCNWFTEQVELLGYVISKDGIAANPKKIKAIMERDAPRNLRELRSFIGMCNYYRNLIPKFAERAAVLYELLRDGVKYEWTVERGEAFENLRKALVSAPILRHPDMRQEFILYSDASDEAAGDQLCQTDENGIEYSVDNRSKLFNKFERNMGISEKEMAAVVYGVREFRHFLIGRHFKIVTDHSALTYLFSIKEPTGKLARWVMYLSQFSFDIVHRKGKLHWNADYLSRPILFTAVNESEVGINYKLDPLEDGFLMSYLQKGRFRKGSSRKQINRIIHILPNFKLEGEVLYMKKDDKWLIVPKKEDRYEIIDKAHAASVHFGSESTTNKIKEKFFWPKMFKEVENFRKNCQTCIRNDNHPISNHPAMSNKVENFNDEISIDWSWGLEETLEGYRGTMNIIESVTNRVEIYEMKTKSEDEIAERFLQYVCTYGPVKRIRSDMEPAMLGKIMEKVKSAMGVEWHKTVAAYSPSHNGKIERFVGTLKGALRKLSERDHRKWVEMIKFVKFAYNTRIHSVTKMTPFELQFGVKANSFDDYTQVEGEIEEDSIIKRAEQIRDLIETREQVVREVELQQEKQMDKQNKRTKRIQRTFLKNCCRYSG